MTRDPNASTATASDWAWGSIEPCDACDRFTTVRVTERDWMGEPVITECRPCSLGVEPRESETGPLDTAQLVRSISALLDSAWR